MPGNFSVASLGAVFAAICSLLLASPKALANPTEYNSQLNTRCNSGDAVACGVLGSRLRNGTDGTVKDQVAARAAFKRACEIGYLAACPNIANMQRRGYGGPKDEAAARQSLIHGCNGNDDDSCRVLGNMYKDGFGGPRNYTLAAEAYDKACKAGKTWVCDLVDEMHSRAAAQAPKQPAPAPAQDYYGSLYEISHAGHIDSCESAVNSKSVSGSALEFCERGAETAHEQFIEMLGKDAGHDTRITGMQSVVVARAYLAKAEFIRLVYDQNRNPEFSNLVCISSIIGSGQLDPHPKYPVPDSLKSEHARLKARFEQLDKWCDSFD